VLERNHPQHDNSLPRPAKCACAHMSGFWMCVYGCECVSHTLCVSLKQTPHSTCLSSISIRTRCVSIKYAFLRHVSFSNKRPHSVCLSQVNTPLYLSLSHKHPHSVCFARDTMHLIYHMNHICVTSYMFYIKYVIHHMCYLSFREVQLCLLKTCVGSRSYDFFLKSV